MRIPSLSPNLCSASQQIALETYESLQDSAKHGYRIHKKTVKGQVSYRTERDFFLKETTITDFLVLNLARTFPRALNVFDFTVSAENKSGADLMIAVKSNGVYRALVLQAKLSNQHGEFRYLRKQQAQDLLIFANSVGAIPAYLFYAYWLIGSKRLRKTCKGSGVGFDERQWAISIAHAQSMLGNGFNGPLDLATSHKFSDPWMCLFCAESEGSIASTFWKSLQLISDVDAPQVNETWSRLFDGFLDRSNPSESNFYQGAKSDATVAPMGLIKVVRTLILLSDDE